MRTIVLLLGLAIGLYAQTDVTVYRLSEATMIGANLMDLASSLNTPGHETNALIGNANGKLAAFKIGIPAIAAGAERLIFRRHPSSPVARRVASIFNFGAAIGPTYAAIHNWRLHR